jgi:hypothetical protein
MFKLICLVLFACSVSIFGNGTKSCLVFEKLDSDSKKSSYTCIDSEKEKFSDWCLK